MNLTIIIPAYKEADNIEVLIDKINKNLKDPYIILVDDSPDNSIEKIIKKFNNLKYIFRGKKLGRGSAVLDGMKEAMKGNNGRQLAAIESFESRISSIVPNL